MVGRGSYSIVMVPGGSPGDWASGRKQADRHSITDLRCGWNHVGDAQPELPLQAWRCEWVLGGLHPLAGRRLSGDRRASCERCPGGFRHSPQPARPRAWPAYGRASKPAFCAAAVAPLRRLPQRLPVAHHRLHLPVRFPQALVARQFPVLLRTPAPLRVDLHLPTPHQRRLEPDRWSGRIYEEPSPKTRGRCLSLPIVRIA